MVRITTIDFPDGVSARIMAAGARKEAAVDANEYLLEILVREKLDEARAMTARRALVRDSRPARAPLRARVGAALIALGERVGGTVAPRAGAAAPRASATAPRRSCATPSAGRG